MNENKGKDFSYLISDVMRLLVAFAISACLLGIFALVNNSVGPIEATGPKSEEEGTASATAAIEYLHVDAPQAARDNGVVTAAEWAEIYPEIVASYEANADNNYITDYLEEDPYLVNIYEGYGFAKDYNSAQGHAYCLEDLAATARPHALANCLTCKTADFTALVNDMGADAYTLEFDSVFADMSENVGCYTCHENQAGDAGKLVVTHDYIISGLGDEMTSIDESTLSCGQCHIEYYFSPINKATSIPYSSVETMTPEAILAYYNEMGFYDWVQESTGAELLKAQHPEMETFLAEGSVHASMGMNCASCHMAVTTSETGVTYTSHELVSPLDSEAILETCAACHGSTDMADKVHTLQEGVVAREKEVGAALSALNDHLTDAVASGSYSEDELNAIRDLYRSAQWFFDFDYVENAEGAHNSKLAYHCLDTAEDYINQAEALFH